MLEFIILCAATWRVTSIVQREKIAERFRQLLGEQFNEQLGVYTYKDTFLSHLIQCFWCVSVWAGIFCMVLFLINPLLLYPFAASAVAIVIDKAI